ncbi:MAG TPA: VanW family protein [Caldilineaceae bacterium]|nr:VanW family protein [Caldilineaceae bacterium]
MHSTLRPSLREMRSSARIRRTPGDFAVLFAALSALALFGLVVWWQVWHTNRIYSGVTIAGVPVGGLTRAAALSRVTQTMLRYPLPTLSIEHNGRQWPITGEQARAQSDLLAAVNRAYLVGRAGSGPGRLADQLVAALGGVDITPDVVFDVAQLRHTVSQIAADVRTPARAATQVGDVTVPAQPGLDVDVEATVERLVSALQAAQPGEHITTALEVIRLEPPASAPASAPTAAPTPLTANAPPALLLQDSRYGLEFALDPATLASILISDNPPEADEERLRRVLEGWAAQIYLAPRDARLRFDPSTGNVTVLQLSKPGRQLNVDASIVAIQEALEAGHDSALLVVEPVAPAVDSNRVAEMGIRELVASGTSYFAGSSRERMRNIQVAAEKFDGVVIPPNGIFSFNKYVEDVSAANGFEDSLIIWGDRTAVGIGGGVCQVSTTVFRAAYNAGMPIVERYNHGYVVDWYGEPGLDATIFTPSVDFKFRNDTGAYLLIEPVVDLNNGVITFNFYGTKPDRQVIISEPVIEDVTPAPPPLYTVDESLAPGQQKQVDWAKQGMTVTVTRTIIEGGATRTEQLVSKYEPWRAVYLVGSADQIPASAQSEAGIEATPEATDAAPAEATPAAEPQAAEQAPTAEAPAPTEAATETPAP